MKIDSLKAPVSLAKLCILAFLLGMILLHLLPNPTLLATTHKMIPYDWRLNFMSEYVRTQYGSLMTFNFLILAAAAIFGTKAMHSSGYRSEAFFLAIGSLFCVLLALFPTDLAELRMDGYNCGDPTRVEPCTWVGLVHNPLSSVVVLALAAVWLNLALRRESRWSSAVRSGPFCLLGAIVLTSLGYGYVAHVTGTTRHWFGLMQRTLMFSALVWFWLLLENLRASRSSRT